MSEVRGIIERLGRIVEDPNAYVAAWKRGGERKAIGILPMNFPAELIHAAGALPVVIQESREPVTLGRSLIFEFYCGYTRSLTDQAVTHQLEVFDGIFLVDHCVALLGAVDAIRFALPDMPVYLEQFPAAMDEPTSPVEVRRRMTTLRDRLAGVCGTAITDAALRESIALSNRDRQLLRQIYDLRRSRRIALSASAMQTLVQSAMVMDMAEHVASMEALVAALTQEDSALATSVPLHFSGHFCHAVKPELLALIESCGAHVIDDDLYTGGRFIATDVPDHGDPIDALTQWYFDRNTNSPCATRAQKDVDWERHLVRSLETSGAAGVVMLMPKFCEPHMLYYPELRKELRERGIPHLLIETELEGLALETVRVRVEAFIEGIKRGASVAPQAA